VTAPIATFSLLHALGCMSPKLALARDPSPGVVLSEQAGAWANSAGLERLPLEWTEGETQCAVQVLRGTASRGSSTAYCFMEARRWHPSAVVPRVLADGIPLLCEMTRRALWETRSEPLDAFVVVALEHGGDFAQYALGDGFDELGADQFRRALGAYRRAEQEGWPGWAEAGVQELDLPAREE